MKHVSSSFGILLTLTCGGCGQTIGSLQVVNQDCTVTNPVYEPRMPAALNAKKNDSDANSATSPEREYLKVRLQEMVEGIRLHREKYTGPYERTHPNGDVAVKGKYADGNRVSEWKYWDVAGNLRATAFYKNGELWNGAFYRVTGPSEGLIGVYKDGRAVSESEFKDGRLLAMRVYQAKETADPLEPCQFTQFTYDEAGNIIRKRHSSEMPKVPFATHWDYSDGGF